jgi:tRNA(Ile)-lysidine synthase
VQFVQFVDKLPVVHDFVRNLITEWRRLELPFEGAPIVVAVSGGADSVSLLLAIDDLRKRKKLDLRIVAAHFDHRLRPDSRSDLEFVRELAEARKFELAYGEWHRPPGGNLEQSARDARYSFLLKTAESLRASHVLTAHTMNDQAETVLMNLIRGSGPEGLGGMHTTRILEGGNGRQGEREQDLTAPLLPFSSSPVSLSRPLIRWAKRRDTENFCLENSVPVTSDPMNEDVNFRRVWVRKVLIPMLQDANPKIVDALCRTAELLRSPASLPPPEFHDHTTGNLDLKHLRTLRDPDLYPILRDWIRLRRGSLRGIGAKHVEAVANLIRSTKSGRIAEVPGGAVVKHDGRLEWHPKTVEKA